MTDTRAGSPDGTDTLINVETIHFTDGTVTYDLADVHNWLSNAVAVDVQGSTYRSTYQGDFGSS